MEKTRRQFLGAATAVPLAVGVACIDGPGGSTDAADQGPLDPRTHGVEFAGGDDTAGWLRWGAAVTAELPQSNRDDRLGATVVLPRGRTYSERTVVLPRQLHLAAMGTYLVSTGPGAFFQTDGRGIKFEGLRMVAEGPGATCLDLHSWGIGSWMRDLTLVQNEAGDAPVIEHSWRRGGGGIFYSSAEQVTLQGMRGRSAPLVDIQTHAGRTAWNENDWGLIVLDGGDAQVQAVRIVENASGRLRGNRLDLAGGFVNGGLLKSSGLAATSIRAGAWDIQGDVTGHVLDIGNTENDRWGPRRVSIVDYQRTSGVLAGDVADVKLGDKAVGVVIDGWGERPNTPSVIDASGRLFEGRGFYADDGGAQDWVIRRPHRDQELVVDGLRTAEFPVEV